MTDETYPPSFSVRAPNFVVSVSSMRSRMSSLAMRPPPEVIAIGAGCEVKPKRSGYLYAYTNDAWNFYDNNRGSVQLTVTRVA